MKLEDQVVSLELAKKLKESGCEQESLFYWVNDTRDEKGNVSWSLRRFVQNGFIGIAAYTVAELGDMLPSSSRVADIRCYKMDNAYWVDRWNQGKQVYMVGGEDKEVDARAKMLLYLKESNDH